MIDWLKNIDWLLLIDWSTYLTTSRYIYRPTYLFTYLIIDWSRKWLILWYRRSSVIESAFDSTSIWRRLKVTECVDLCPFDDVKMCIKRKRLMRSLPSVCHANIHGISRCSRFHDLWPSSTLVDDLWPRGIATQGERVLLAMSAAAGSSRSRIFKGSRFYNKVLYLEEKFTIWLPWQINNRATISKILRPAP